MPPTASKSLYDERAQAVSEARQLLERAERENRDLNAGEQAHYARIDERIDQLTKQIDLAERRQSAVAGRVSPGTSISKPSANEPLKLTIRGRELSFAPGTLLHAAGQPRYLSTFEKYIQSGGKETLGLKVSENPKGGYLAPTAMSAEIIKFVDDNVFMRQIGNVLPSLGQAVSLGVPSFDTDLADADWTPEVPASDISEDDAARFGKREFMPHLFTKLVKMSRKLLRHAPNVMGYMTERIGYKAAVTMEKAYLTGDGAQQPLGIFVASDDGIPTSRDVTASSSTAFTADDLIDSLYNLKEQYQRNATLVASREFIKRCRKLKDGNGQYLWQPGLAGQPGTILDRPYVMSEYAPNTFTASQYIACWGDYKAGYWIADALGMEIEDVSILFSLRNNSGILMRMETDGAPVLAEAFSRLILSA